MSSHSSKKGLVTKKFNEFFYVDVKDNFKLLDKKRFLCKSRKSLRFKSDFIFVGDEVNISQINCAERTAIIDNLISRKNFLERPAVANISDIYVTFSVEEPKLDFSQVSKLLIHAEYLNVNTSLLLTKCDLITDNLRNVLIEKFKGWGYHPKTLNLEKSSDFQSLINDLKTKKCSILMGPSGVGKTTLLNRIIPNLQNPTASVSFKIKRGKNTTRNVELFSLNKDSYIVDTPGFNLNKIEIASKYIALLFPEISNQIKQNQFGCKFNDCLHIDEPGCQINKNFDRYKYYRKLIIEAKNRNYQNLGD
ncbi:MAG: ribosome small subunit-dependent GTPase A [Prochlorococcus sp. SP3034]|nr:ribosome small subunit-dependent GTPase A [Prochlorococcus sp. SP3034]|tara:strand:- start:11063 stop:11980 length:918 start_codon:yes stop_codon:yes gene_type:complete